MQSRQTDMRMAVACSQAIHESSLDLWFVLGSAILERRGSWLGPLFWCLSGLHVATGGDLGLGGRRGGFSQVANKVPALINAVEGANQ